jgi:hypothetical protein
MSGALLMKKTYQKPVMVRREMLSKVTAFNGAGSDININ